MVLIYKFKKERLQSGVYATRPRILVELSGEKSSIIVPALIDTGCDITVIPEEIAKSIGLYMKGEKNKLYGYRESTDAVQSSAKIRFLGKEHRQSVTLPNIPILIAIKEEGVKEEEDITLGIDGIFDVFEITFKKAENRIIFKMVVSKQILK